MRLTLHVNEAPCACGAPWILTVGGRARVIAASCTDCGAYRTLPDQMAVGLVVDQVAEPARVVPRRRAAPPSWGRKIDVESES